MTIVAYSPWFFWHSALRQTFERDDESMKITLLVNDLSPTAEQKLRKQIAEWERKKRGSFSITLPRKSVKVTMTLPVPPPVEIGSGVVETYPLDCRGLGKKSQEAFDALMARHDEQMCTKHVLVHLWESEEESEIDDDEVYALVRLKYKTSRATLPPDTFIEKLSETPGFVRVGSFVPLAMGQAGGAYGTRSNIVGVAKGGRWVTGGGRRSLYYYPHDTPRWVRAQYGGGTSTDWLLVVMKSSAFPG